MTFNGISWGYLDSKQAQPYSYNAPRILKMLNTCASGGGNLLLNIGPTPDGSVPKEAVEPLTQVGNWLKENGPAVYGKMVKSGGFIDRAYGGNGVWRIHLSGKYSLSVECCLAGKRFHGNRRLYECSQVPSNY
jgi:alpha-L-fucosidase